ncbi:unnamed protein product [Aureobasidium uvarum]|uniref:Uncharacterized protein n=1 Tax=Aureobasidium uvarum TaxID=2773716 RepID=A0A9N8KEU4_9PEZI|nr:unnamed protein product [Aureobasidium uvarum]
MTYIPYACECIDSSIPVFATALINHEFFEQSDAACQRCGYSSPQATLVTSKEISAITSETVSPVPSHHVQASPFLGYFSLQIIEFTIERLDGTDLSPTNMIILDERTNNDRTCLLLPKDEMRNDTRAYMQVRSDVESSVIALKTVETG